MHRAAHLASSSCGSLCHTRVGHPMVIFRVRSWPQWTGARKVVVVESLAAQLWHPGCVLLWTALMTIWRYRKKDALHTSESHCCIAVMMYHKVRKNTWGAEVSRLKSLWGISSAQAHASLFEEWTRPLFWGQQVHDHRRRLVCACWSLGRNLALSCSN